MSEKYYSRVYLDRPDYADFEPPEKFNAILSIIGRRLREHPNAICSYSGGSDSDLLIDLVERARRMFDLPQVKYVFFNTGLEMKATRDHVKEIAAKYGIEIMERRPKINIVRAVRQNGIPFVSKIMSTGLEGWQKKGLPLSIADEYAEADDKAAKRRELKERYPGCESTINFLCGCNSAGEPRPNIQLVINSSKWMLDFIKENPPDFRISSRCCDYCKKQLAHSVQKDFEMVITGERRAEGGMRSVPRKDNTSMCFTESGNGQFRLRPLYYVDDDDKAWYKERYKLRYSDAYEVYGLRRTGCCGCPISYRAVQDLEMIEPYEPNLVKAAWNVFGPSYEYRRKYDEYKQKRKAMEKSNNIDAYKGETNMNYSKKNSMVPAEGQEMNTANAVALRMIETRISECMNGIAYNLLGVGRCLVEAKDAKLVPHGQWEQWVRDQTGMSEERAQRLMRAARNAPEGSAMAKLPVSKILALLPLPEDQREAVAEDAAENGTTVEQLRKQVAELTRQVEQEAGKARDATNRAANAAVLNDKLAQAMRAAEAGEQEALDRLQAIEQRMDEVLAENAEYARRNEEAGISREAQQLIDELQSELADAQEYAAQQSELRQQAQQELLNAQLGRGDNSEVRGFNAQDLVDATQAFIGQVGGLPLMGVELSKMNDGTRSVIQAQIGRVGDWVERANAAMKIHLVDMEPVEIGG